MEILSKALNWWTAMIDFPALILLMIFVLGIYVLWKTQTADNNFNFSDMLRDDSGKPSSSRLATFVCLGITSWGLMYILVHGKGEIDTLLFLGYTAIWSGAKVAEKMVDAYAASRGGTVTTTTATATKTDAGTKVSRTKTEVVTPSPLDATVEDDPEPRSRNP